MTKHLSITEALESVDVDLWGHKYRSRPLTRSANERMEELRRDAIKAEAAETEEEAGNSDELVQVFASMLSLLLEPNGTGEEGEGPPDVQELIMEHWRADDLPVANLVKLTYGLAEAQRPF